MKESFSSYVSSTVMLSAIFDGSDYHKSHEWLPWFHHSKQSQRKKMILLLDSSHNQKSSKMAPIIQYRDLKKNGTPLILSQMSVGAIASITIVINTYRITYMNSETKVGRCSNGDGLCLDALNA